MDDIDRGKYYRLFLNDKLRNCSTFYTIDIDLYNKHECDFNFMHVQNFYFNVNGEILSARN